MFLFNSHAQWTCYIRGYFALLSKWKGIYVYVLHSCESFDLQPQCIYCGVSVENTCIFFNINCIMMIDNSRPNNWKLVEWSVVPVPSGQGHFVSVDLARWVWYEEYQPWEQRILANLPLNFIKRRKKDNWTWIVFSTIISKINRHKGGFWCNAVGPLQQDHQSANLLMSHLSEVKTGSLITQLLV